MTRETKIGLLVGLAFIIVIGILLSDHLTSTLQPPQAPLSVAAVSVREGVASPGVGQVSQERPVQVPEARPNPIQIQRDEPRRETGHAVVTILPPSSNGGAGREVIVPSRDARPTDVVVIPPPQQQQQQDQPIVVTETPRPPTGTGLDRLRAEHPDELVVVPVEGVREYKAEPGDTISKIARRQLGADTRANQQAILKLNPGLNNDPKQLRAGETYMIPVASETTPPPVATNPPTVIPVGTPPTTRPSSDNLYTTRSGDTLWSIARRELGAPTAWEQIRDLNRDVLKGGDRIKPGMKLKLPVKSVATSSAQANGSM